MTDPIDALFANPDGTDPQASGQKSEGGKLREQLEQVLAANRELQQQVAAQAARERDRAISEAFGKHKVPDLARDFFPKDAEPTDESVTGFVEKYGQLWGASSATATTPPAQQAQTQAMQQFTSTAPDADLSVADEAAGRAMFATATSKEDVLRTLREAGAQIG